MSLSAMYSKKSGGSFLLYIADKLMSQIATSSPLKTIFFDIGNVLIFFSHEKMFSQVAACCGLETARVKELLTKKGLQEKIESGKTSAEALYQFFLQKGRRPFSLHELLHAASDIFTPNPSIWPLIEQLKAKGIRLILLSNTNEYHFNRVYSETKILKLFDDKILSHEVGVMKPNPEIFAKALSLARCPPEHCFYTDDVPAFVRAARKQGIDAEVYTSPEALRKHLRKRGVYTQTN